MSAKKISKRRQRSVPPFARILNGLMKERKVGVREAARIAGVAASTIVSWRGGALPEDYRAVKRLAEVLGVSFTFLLTGESEESVGAMAARAEGPMLKPALREGRVLFDGYARIKIQEVG